MASAIPIPCRSNRLLNAAPHGDTVAEQFQSRPSRSPSSFRKSEGIKPLREGVSHDEAPYQCW
jgi:hypothetical protein